LEKAMPDISIEISEEAKNLIQAMRDYVGPFIVPAAGTAIGYVAGRRKEHAEANKFEAEADKLTAEGEAAKLDSLTRHFEALIEGYETRVKDLVNEVSTLREEVLSLRKALDQRPRPRN
jgi:hypothetical protein